MASQMLAGSLQDLQTLCSRCVLCYTTPSNTSNLFFIEQVDSNQNHCGSCLGILEQDQILNVVNQVANEMNAADYKTDTFSLSISLPQCLVLRKRALLTHIKNSNLYDKDLHGKHNELMNLKEAFRISTIEKIQELTKKKFNIKSPLMVKLEYSYEKEDEEIKSIESLLPKPSNKRKFQRKHNTNQKSPLNNIQLVTEAINDIPDLKVDFYTAVPPTSVENPCQIKISFIHEPIHIAGRYNKYSRELSQTPWFIDGERKTESSVQELICDKLLEITGSAEVKFMSSGREDCDVRMLGKGRPFVAALINPRMTTLPREQLDTLQKEINNSTDLVGVRDLQVTDKESLSILKAGENEKKKCYSAKVWCPELITEEKIQQLNSLSDLKINQKTPLRVLHRRPLCVRVRSVFSLNLTRLDGEEGQHHYQLLMKTEAGTYIKEFVHSDLGRTEPSLCSLMGVPFDILQLDVDEVELDWPPSIPVETLDSR